MNVDNHNPGTVRRLRCCRCGEDAGTWQQHWNRDTGWGVCAACVVRERAYGAGDAEIDRLYGVAGINYEAPP